MKWLTLLLVLTAALRPLPGAGQQPEARIGILLDGATDRTLQLELLIRSEIDDLVGTDFAPVFPDQARIVADWTMAGVQDGLRRLLSDETLDLVLALGPLASSVAVQTETLPRPVVAPYVPSGATGLPRQGPGSGAANLNYLILPQVLQGDLPVLREAGGVSSVAVLMSEAYLAAFTDQSRVLEDVGEALNMDVWLVPVGSDLGEALGRIPDEADGVYLTPLMTLSSAAFQTLVDSLNARQLPSMSLLGLPEVEAGVFLTLTPPGDAGRRARRIALHVQRILLGDAASELPVSYARGARLTLNMATARLLGVFPPWTVLTEAELLNRRRSEPARTLSLPEVVRQALEANLDLAAADRAVAAGRQEVREARSTLLPQVEASAVGTVVDEDRAEASLGTQAQRSLSGGGTFTQLVYSERAWANLGVQRRLQESREEDREALRLDVVRDAAVAYLGVLRAETLERVQRDNVRTTRAFLELAQIREDVGTSGPGEVLRWQARLAESRRAVLDAQATRQQAETELNRLLNRPLEENFATREPGLDDPSLVTSDPRLDRYTGDPWSFVVFRDFMEEEAWRNSPELRGLGAAIAAQERLYLSARRAYWVPSLALQGRVTGLLGEGGAGSEPSFGQVPGVPDLSGVFPTADDLSWSLALQASIPVFTSGARAADAVRARESLRELRLRREAARQRVAQRVRVALLATGASFPGIELARDAADAARRNRELVRDAYAEGAVSAVELLDAQSAALNAEAAAAAAVYEFLVDLIDVERAAGQFNLLREPAEREAFWQRIADFFESAPPPDRTP